MEPEHVQQIIFIRFLEFHVQVRDTVNRLVRSRSTVQRDRDRRVGRLGGDSPQPRRHVRYDDFASSGIIRPDSPNEGSIYKGYGYGGGERSVIGCGFGEPNLTVYSNRL